MIPAAALYRVSTSKQEKKESIPVQQNAARKYCAEHNFNLVKEYVEPGISAFKISSNDRDILQDAIKDAQDGKFKVLLVYKHDRLSRLSHEYIPVLMCFSQAGVTVISVAENRILTTDDMTQKMLRFMEGWQAEYESKNTSLRVSACMLEYARQGKWSGGRPPYGFRLSQIKNGLPLEINPEEAIVINEMANLYEQGMGSKKIAQILNERGIRTREGKLWRDSRVRDVLQNPIIAGLPAYNRTKPGKTPNSRVRRRNNYDILNPEIIIQRDENGNPIPTPEYVIIPLERWLKIIQRMKNLRINKEKDQRSLRSTALLTGFLKCGYCGRGFISSKSKQKKVGPNGKTYVYDKAVYRCTTKARIGTKYCDGQGSYSQTKIDKIFMNELEDFLSSLNLNRLDQYVNTRHNFNLHRLRKEVKQLESELQKAKRRHESWIERLNIYFEDPSKSLYSEELLAEEVKKAENRVKTLNKNLVEIKKELTRAEQDNKNMKIFSKTAHIWYEVFQSCTIIEKKKKMLAQIIDSVILWKDRMEICYSINLKEFAEIEPEENMQNEFKLRVAVSI